MLRKFLSFVFCLAFCVFVVQAQTVMKGEMTNMLSAEKSEMKFTRTFSFKENIYTSDYKLSDAKNATVGILKVAYNKTSGKINVRLLTRKDTTMYEFTYADSLGSLFGLRGAFKKAPAGKFELVLSFLSQNKTYLKVSQVMDKNAVARTHYQLERILGDDVTLNVTLLKKLKSQPLGNGNTEIIIQPDTTRKVVLTSPLAVDKQVNPSPTTTTTITTGTTTTKTDVTPKTTPEAAQPVITQEAPVKVKPSSGNSKEWFSDSLKTILKPTKNRVVTVKLFIQGGTANYTLAKEGIEALALQWAVNGGTKTMSAEAIQSKLGELNTTINYSCGFDYSSVTMTCTRETFDESWNIFSDILLKPAFNPDEFTYAREDLLGAEQFARGDEVEVMKRNAMDLLFIGKFYDRNPLGSEYSVNRLGVDEVKKYYTGMLCRRKSTFIVTGDFDQDELSPKIRSFAKSLPAGSLSLVPDNPLEISSSNFKLQEPEGTENYILGISSAPSAGSDEELALQFAFVLLNNRFNSELKEKRNLSNDANIQTAGLRQNFSLLTLTSENPDKAIQAVIDEIKKVRKTGFTNDEIQKAKDDYLTQFYLQNETNAALADLLGRFEMTGDWENAEKYYSSISNLAVTDLNAAVKRYLKAFKFFYSGSKDAANEIIFTQKIE